MRHLLVVPLLAVVVLYGCGGSEPEEPPPPAVQEAPDKTADQLYEETMRKLNPMLTPNDPKTYQINLIIADARSKFRPPMEPNGDEALSKIKRDFEQRLQAALKAEQWNYVVALSKVLEQFAKGPPEHPGELKKLERYSKRAQAELSKPKVAVKGFVDDYVFLEVTIPTTGKKYSEQVREGDSFLEDPDDPSKYMLRLEDIIGDNREVRVYYYKTDTSWTIKGPRG